MALAVLAVAHTPSSNLSLLTPRTTLCRSSQAFFAGSLLTTPIRVHTRLFVLPSQLSDNPVPFLRSLLSAFPLERFQRTSAPDRVPPFSFRLPHSMSRIQSQCRRAPCGTSSHLNVPDPDSRGGATFSHWSGEKEACPSLVGHCTRGDGHVP